ncbi:MAG: hypothetical protein V2A70_06060 [Candidatus Omnitrophota bacterium]
MRIRIQVLKCWVMKSVYLGLAVGVVLVGAGCASAHKTTITETRIAYPNSTEVGSGDEQNRAVVEKSETTTATTETKSGHPGILSSTVHAIGWVIALPFKLIGGLIGWIF